LRFKQIPARQKLPQSYFISCSRAEKDDEPVAGGEGGGSFFKGDFIKLQCLLVGLLLASFFSLLILFLAPFAVKSERKPFRGELF